MKNITISNKNFEPLAEEIKRFCRAQKSWNKCFGIGSNKTGTTSLAHIFKDLFGYRCNQSKVELTSTIQIIKGNFMPFKQVMSELDFHQDLPISQGHYYIAIDALFPNSKFILTTRDSRSWAESTLRRYGNRLIHVALNLESLPRASLFTGYSHSWISHFMRKQIAILKTDLEKRQLSDGLPPKDYEFSSELKASLIKDYEERNEEIINYFKYRPDDLLVIDLSCELNTRKITKFLGISCHFSAPIPHKNKKSAGTTEREIQEISIDLDAISINQILGKSLF